MSDTPITDAVEKSFGEMPGAMRKLERENAKMRYALGELLRLRKNCEGDIGWRGKKKAIVADIRVHHILLIEEALKPEDGSNLPPSTR